MKFRFTALLLAVPAVLAGLLVSVPADAATYNAKVTTRTVAMYKSGSAVYGKVYVKCSSSKACKGTLRFDEGLTKSYAVRARSGAYVTLHMYSTSQDNPFEYGTTSGDYKYIDGVNLTINESSPTNSSPRTYTTMRTETRVLSQEITGDLVPLGGAQGMSDLTVELIRVVRGGNTERVAFREVSETGTTHYSFTVALGVNNAPSTAYRLKIRGIDSSGKGRSWYYRGGDNEPTGGGRYLIDASPIQAKKDSNFDADFRYTSISGTAGSGAGSEVTVVAPPPSYSSNVFANREIDYPRCGNVFGAAKAGVGGSYEVGFLPATTSLNTRYALSFRSPGGSVEVWYGAGANGPYGSCYDATDYNYSKANLITLTSPLNRGTDAVSTSLYNNVTVQTAYAGSFSSKATSADKWISIREYVPGLTVLESPVVRELQTSTGYDNKRLFDNLRPGKFWIEVGRHNGCNSWQPSRYSNNNLYFKGADRGAEAWKAFSTLGSLSSAMRTRALGADPGATNAQNSRPSGYAGWSFRNYCKTYGAGFYDTRELRGSGQNYDVNLGTNPRGAVVSGRVTRAGGKTNKEILVRLSSTDGKRVTRTDVTDGSGRFYIAGLASGKWTISVNSDSWRGIGRGFTGKRSITVHAGGSYGAGTLRFTG
ncbi:MAG: carboxypeptidase-like regulatory domain-containing protein [Aeromicrobium sp.]